MSKAVMTSASPQECERIARGEQTMLVMKTKPRLETPFKGYLCCKNGKPYLYREANPPYDLFLDSDLYRGGDYEKRFLSGKVIGEFVCDEIDKMLPDYNPATKQFFYNDDWQHNDWNSIDYCLSVDELNGYGRGKTLYGWHISNLKIYDKPKDLSVFRKACDGFVDCIFCSRHIRDKYGSCDKRLTRPPQSWQYVEEL